MKKRGLKKTVILWLAMTFGLIQIFYFAPNSYALSVVKSKAIDYTKNIDVQHGDFIFQHLPGSLTQMIVDVSEGQYSHCGIIVNKRGRYYVLEAIGPVRETPLHEWISRGIKDQFSVVRLRKEYRGDIPEIIKAAYKYLGKPYDIQYEFDDEKIYCSELIYKAALEGAGIELGDIRKLGDMKWQDYEGMIREISGGNLPLDRLMITPDAVVLADQVQTIHSSFSAEKQEGVFYSESDLAGIWDGTYMLVDLSLDIDATVDSRGIIEKGGIQSGLSLKNAKLKSFNKETGEFQYIFRSMNNIKIVLNGRVDFLKDAMYGTWKDSLGYRGSFHLGKEKI